MCLLIFGTQVKIRHISEQMYTYMQDIPKGSLATAFDEIVISDIKKGTRHYSVETCSVFTA